jgi:intracellular septation protein
MSQTHDKALRAMPPLVKIAVEAGPLVAFFIANARAGIFWGTGTYMVAAAIALTVAWIMTRRIAIVPVVTLVFVLAFGALTLALHDDTFIKMKVTLINALFGVILAGGLVFGRSLLKPVFGEAMALDDDGWKKLTFRWALFFFAVAGLNEAVWRNVSTDVWVNFKVFGILPLTFVFALAQMPLMQRHALRKEEGAD